MTARARISSLVHYLTFQLEGRPLAVDLATVREVITLGPVTPVPGSPGGVVGAAAVRGTVLPVLDLRPGLGLPTPAPAREGDAALRLLVPPHELLLLVGQPGEVTGELTQDVHQVDLQGLVSGVAAAVAEAANHYQVHPFQMAAAPGGAPSRGSWSGR